MPDSPYTMAAPGYPPSPALAWIETTNRCNFHLPTERLLEGHEDAEGEQGARDIHWVEPVKVWRRPTAIPLSHLETPAACESLEP